MSLRDRLRAARHTRFVGREDERALFKSALSSGEPPFYALYLYGPGGVGKTALMGEFEHAAASAGVPTARLDAREVEPTPEAFQHVAEPLLPTLDAERSVLFIDTLETVAGLEDWLRTAFLPELPDGALVVMASRQPPGPRWRGDVGWQALLRTVPLRNLTPAESRALLAAQGVPEPQQAAAADATHGHPLALALVAERYRLDPAFSLDFADAPDVVTALLRRFVEEADAADGAAALEAAAAVRTVTEELLADLLGDEGRTPREAFAWLRGLSFVEDAPDGLRLHDLARDALAADLRWRLPERFAELERRARAHYTRALLGDGGAVEQQRVLTEYAFLHRHNPVVRPLFAELRAHWQGAQPRVGNAPEDAAGWDALRRMVERHEGTASAEIAAAWFHRRPESVRMFRGADGEPQGFLFLLPLDALSGEERESDPAAEAALRYLDEHAPLRAGERATLFRFWMDAEAHQQVSAVQSLVFVATVRHYLSAEGLAFTLLPCAEPDYWRMVLTLAGLRRLPEADFEVGGRSYGVYGHDWRAVPPAQWLNRLAEQGLSLAAPAAEEPAADRLVVLSEPDFAEAVRAALRDYARPHDLEGSLLLRSRLVARRADGGDRVAALRAALDEAAEQLRATPKEELYYLALDATYLDPARTQAEAAEQLDLAFSTYRRYLKRAIEHVVAALWQEELRSE